MTVDMEASGHLHRRRRRSASRPPRSSASPTCFTAREWEPHFQSPQPRGRPSGDSFTAVESMLLSDGPTPVRST